MDEPEEYEQVEISSEELGIPAETDRLSAKHALDLFDATWYNRTSQFGRWMDIIGDYAGDELFLIDGDSLCGMVLDDPLLAVGRDNDNSFQFLHARYSLERLLKHFLKRNAVFEVVFFEDHRHSTYQTGASEFVTSSRCLARSLLQRSLLELQIPVNVFQNLDDPEWLQYCIRRKPMLVMTDDGGPVEKDTKFRAGRALVYRTFIYDLLAIGIAVALMRGVEFRDSKIFSIIYEQRRISGTQSQFDARIWSARNRVGGELDAKLPTACKDAATDRTTWLIQSARDFLASDASDVIALPLLYVFVAHALILDAIPLQLRAQRQPTLPLELEQQLRNDFLPRLFRCLEKPLPESPTFRDMDLDGRIFLHLLQSVIMNANVVDLIGPHMASAVEATWNALGISDEVDLGILSSRFQGFEVPMPIPEPPMAALSVLPFSHPVFDQHLAPVRVHVEPDPPVPDHSHLEFGTGLGTVFEDNMHWHNSRRPILPNHLGGNAEKQPAVDNWSRQRALRRDQHFMAALQRQAQSLTGALGRPLHEIVIPAVGTNARVSRPVNKTPGHAHSPSSKASGKQKLTSTEKTRLSIQEKKRTEKDSKDTMWWKERLVELQRLLSNEMRIEKADSLLRNPRVTEGWLAVEVRLYRLHLELMVWIDHPARDKPVVKDKFRVSALGMVKDLAAHATPTAAACLASVLVALGFPNFVPTLCRAGDPPALDRKLSFDFVKVTKRSGSAVHKFMRLDEHPTHWLLRCFGEYMDRSLDSKPDPRVQFEPDGWQRKVLDSLDEDASVLVVAPTSAGKTFISFYAMERVLRSSDDGILVYVAPTKALVTQIAAEVSARFKKDIHGRSCWAIHTRDYRIHDPQKCQILITVPEVFAIMLLSPPLAQVWTPRLKRIILDEIHVIGQQEEGTVWEQILLLAPCPIIGLSATVGQPERFNEWLSSVQSAHNFKHTFIQHPYRYSHLRKFFYLPSTEQREFAGLAKYKQTCRLRPLHPVCLLASGMARSLPPDFTLEPQDCLSLFKSVKDQIAHCGISAEEIEALDPAEFFPQDRLLKQEDVSLFEKALKDILAKLIDSPNSHQESSSLQAIVNSLLDPKIAETSTDTLTATTRKSVLANDLIHLVSDLHADDDLPALVFSFDRHQCEIQAQCLLDRLERAEEQWRGTNSEWLSKMKSWEDYQANEKERNRAQERAQRQRPNEDQEGRSIASDDLSWEAHFDPSDPSPEFSFAGVRTSYTKSSLKLDLEQLEYTSTPEWALQAIKRGIAVHHSGMNRKYRVLVETLFRVGFLRVVIATGSLALGINAPCRTVIFCGDVRPHTLAFFLRPSLITSCNAQSTYLTALQYRQAAGRAGRRGHDLLGKVVFYGLPLDRVQRLVLSRLPAIAGQFPLSTTLCLRLFNLLAGSQDAPCAVKAISAILALPQISSGSDTGKYELLHHLRFSIDYLQRARLLSADGQPLNLTGAVSHLYYHEPNNLAFVALLRGGVIHRICNQSSIFLAKRELMIILCHLFGRRRLPRAALNEDTLRPLTKRYPSMIVLPPLPPAARELLTDHEALILRVFAGYARTYASQYASQLGPDNVLPLSDVRVTPTMAMESSFTQKLHSTALSHVARSTFVATSGHNDLFASVGELCYEARQGLHLNESAIPSMDGVLADAKSPYQLNAYLLDFYTHGQVETLARANGIRKGDVWFLLQDFTLALKTIQTSIQELLLKSSKQYVAAEDEDNSGYARLDIRDEIESDGQWSGAFKHPPGVSRADWRVYEVLTDVWTDFDAKFRAMWA